MDITITHVYDPCEYLILDNVCTPEELNNCFNEAKLLTNFFKDESKTGSAREEDGTLKKRNKGIFLEGVYNSTVIENSPISIAISKVFGTAKTQEYTPYSQMNYLKIINSLGVLLSGYKNGDYYLSHKDSSTLSLLFWFGQQTFIGGDLVFKEFNHTIPFVSNRAIIFPSYFQHEITKVEAVTDDYVRYSALGFLTINSFNGQTQPTTTGTSDF